MSMLAAIPAKSIADIWARIDRGGCLGGDVGDALCDLHRRLAAVERATLPQPYNPDEAEGGTAGGPVRLVCENHRDKAWPDECDCGPGMRGDG